MAASTIVGRRGLAGKARGMAGDPRPRVSQNARPEEESMKRSRRQFLHLAAGTVALPAISRLARAQAYPTRPITMVVPVPAGAGADTVGRTIAERMRASL